MINFSFYHKLHIGFDSGWNSRGKRVLVGRMCGSRCQAICSWMLRMAGFPDVQEISHRGTSYLFRESCCFAHFVCCFKQGKLARPKCPRAVPSSFSTAAGRVQVARCLPTLVRLVTLLGRENSFRHFCWVTYDKSIKTIQTFLKSSDSIDIY